MSRTQSRYELNIIVIMCLEVTYNIFSACKCTQRIGVGVERIKIISLTTNYLYVNLFKLCIYRHFTYLYMYVYNSYNRITKTKQFPVEFLVLLLI